MKWFLRIYVVLVVLTSGYLAVQVHQSEMEYARSPQAKIDREERIRDKIWARHGEEALADYDAGIMTDEGTRNDVVYAAAFAPLGWAFMTFIFTGFAGFLLWLLGEKMIKGWRRLSVNHA